MTEKRKKPMKLYDISRAIEQRRVALCFQPIVSARDHRFPIFHEGLMRLFDEDGEVRVAGEFMNEVAGTEVCNFIDQLALELALQKLKEEPGIRVSINMDMRTMWDGDWMHLLETTGKTNRRITERLIIEFTEASVMRSIEQTKAFMAFCSQFGVCFACDDFGAGQTVIGHLREFNFDIIKIDGSICQDVSENEDNEALIKAILSIAHYFDMVTVAEYIDTHASALKCKELGVDGLQGFLFRDEALYNPEYLQLVNRAKALKAT